MIALIDFDSLLYKAVYKIVSFSELKNKFKEFGKEGAKQWLMETVYNEGINRCENELLKMIQHVQSLVFEEITGYELYITTCKDSFRKKLDPLYKSNRKVKNKYVWLLLEHYKMNDCFYDSKLEADDLIAIRAKELGLGNCIVVSIDKDLKQIGGYYWSYYKQKEKDMYGNFIKDERGYDVSSYKQKEVVYIDEKEALFLFWQQMLIGDVADNIKGIKGIGEKRSVTILNKSKNLFISVAREYLKRDRKYDFKKNFKLLKLGEDIHYKNL